MIRHHLTITATALQTCTGLLLCYFAGQAAASEDVSYPPPPGAYRSEPASVWSDIPYSPGTLQQAGSDDTPVTPAAGGSSMLPLPDNGYDSRSGRYDAITLFGSRQPMEKAAPEFGESAQRPEAEQQSPPRPDPAPYPTAPPPERNDFSMDFRRDRQRPAVEHGFQPPEGWGHQGYPAYAPAYPAYQDYPPALQSGQMTGHAPAPPKPVYPDYRAGGYAPAYPQAGGGMPPQDYDPGVHSMAPDYASDGYDTGTYPPAQDPLPGTVTLPGTADSILFRPTD